MVWFHAISLRNGELADGVHLLWSPPPTAGYSELGWELWRRPARRAPRLDSCALTRLELEMLHRGECVETAFARISVRAGVVPEPGSLEVPNESLDPDAPDDWAAQASAAERRAVRRGTPGRVRRSGPRVPKLAQGSITRVGGVRPAVVYRVELRGPARRLRVELEARCCLGVGFYAGEAVIAIPPLVTGAGASAFNFDAAPIDEVVIYALSEASGLSSSPEGVESTEREWSQATLLASGVQLPFAAFDPTLVDVEDERLRAESRLLPGERLGAAEFERLSWLMNSAGAGKDRFSPAYLSSFSRARPDAPFVEAPALRYGSTLANQPSWRRALGFGYLDEGAGLTPGGFYDYRLVGWFFRRDLEERTIGFHTLPPGLTLPDQCNLGGIRLDCGTPLTVATPKGPAPDGLEFVGRKGVALRGRLTLRLPEPITRLILEFEVGEPHSLEYRALSGGPLCAAAVVSVGSVPRAPRVELDFPAPVDRVELLGGAFLYAIRSSSLGPGEDPEQLVRVARNLYGVRYEPTPAPSPPPVLGTVSAPAGFGFRLRWLPPPPTGSIDPELWPPDLAAALPCEALYFRLERRRVDTGEAFEPVALAGHASATTVAPVNWGDELFDHYPEQPRHSPPVSVLMEHDDHLSEPPGALYQYRIASVDRLGRRSTPTFGSLVRLEKRVPPPMPLDVQIRVITAGPGLSAADRERLGRHTTAIICSWRWTDEQRRADPYARSFRVYFTTDPAAASSPDHARPGAWEQRCAVCAIGVEDHYEHVLFDRLEPRVCMGVSTADDQPYVADQRSTGMFGGRPGNESDIVRVGVSLG